MKILNEEFDIDFLDAETAERYEKALKNYNEAYAELDEKKKSVTMAEIIKGCCYIVFDYFDDLLGEGAAKQIFNGRLNLRQAFKAMQDVSDEITRQTEEMQREFPKFPAKTAVQPQNRQQRRELKKQEKSRHFQLMDVTNESAD